MNIKLINYAPNAINTMALGASKCYDTTPKKSVVEGCVSNKHSSITEHSFYAFEVSGVSRAFLAQLTRHRHLSYTVESQRYVENKGSYVIPEKIKNNPQTMLTYNKHIAETMFVYKTLIKAGIPKEDARFVLPEAMETKLVVSGSYRAWMEFCEKRMAKNAQWEIREFAFEVDRLIHSVTDLKGFKIRFGHEELAEVEYE